MPEIAQIGDGEGSAHHLIRRDCARLNRRGQPFTLLRQCTQTQRLAWRMTGTNSPRGVSTAKPKCISRYCVMAFSLKVALSAACWGRTRATAKRIRSLIVTPCSPNALVARLEAFAQRQERAGIRGSVQRQLRRTLQRMQHPFGNHLAYAAQRDGFALPHIPSWRRWKRGRGSVRQAMITPCHNAPPRPTPLVGQGKFATRHHRLCHGADLGLMRQRCLNIALDDAPAGATPLDATDLHLLCVRPSARARGEMPTALSWMQGGVNGGVTW